MSYHSKHKWLYLNDCTAFKLFVGGENTEEKLLFVEGTNAEEKLHSKVTYRIISRHLTKIFIMNS